MLPLWVEPLKAVPNPILRKIQSQQKWNKSSFFLKEANVEQISSSFFKTFFLLVLLSSLDQMRV